MAPDPARQGRLVVLAMGIVGLLVLVTGSIAVIVTGAVDTDVGGYLAFGGLAVVGGYVLVPLVRHLRAGAPLARSGPERAAAARRWRRLNVFSLVLMCAVAISFLGHPLWRGELDWWRIGQGVFWAVMAACLGRLLRRTRVDGSEDAARR
jgi:hypothetical protein